MAIKLKVEIIHDDRGIRGEKRDCEMSHRFYVDNTAQIGWITEQIIKVLNSEEWKKFKTSRSSKNQKKPDQIL